jgi:hypothetical protein
MQLKLFVINLLIGVMIVNLILFSQVFTALAGASSSSDQTDKELKDKDIKQKSKSSDTKPSNQQNNTVTQAEGEEEHESNDDTGGRGLKQNITIDDTHPSDNIPFELPLDNTLPFP